MKPTFDHTVNVLVQAYLNDTLVHGVCTACAVGNIIASSLGCKVKRDSWEEFQWYRNQNEIQPIWHEVFSSEAPGEQRFNRELYTGWHKKQIDATGYTVDELARIEFAFESVPVTEDHNDYNSDKHMYLGLMAVVDVLAEIHNVDLSVRESAKLQFVKP